MSRRQVLIAAVGLALSSPLAAGAEESASGRDLTLTYDGVLLVKVLDMQLREQLQPGGFTAQARLKSYGVLALFKRIDVEASASGRLQEGRAQPALFRHINRDGENRSVEVRWTGADVATKVSIPYYSVGDPAPTREQKLAAADPLTQLARIALTAPGRSPCEGQRSFFDGRQLYRLDFEAPTAREAAPREAQLGLVQPIRCRFTFTEVAGFDPKPAGKQNMGLGHTPLTMDLARVGEGGPWLIAAVRGKTPLGEAKIQLRDLSRPAQ